MRFRVFLITLLATVSLLGTFGPTAEAATGASVSGYPPELRLGSSGPSVAALHNLLGLLKKGHDFTFDAKTEKAVRAFQTIMKLDVDGVVGKQTWTALFNVRDAQETKGARVIGAPKALSKAAGLNHIAIKIQCPATRSWQVMIWSYPNDVENVNNFLRLNKKNQVTFSHVSPPKGDNVYNFQCLGRGKNQKSHNLFVTVHNN